MQRLRGRWAELGARTRASPVRTSVGLGIVAALVLAGFLRASGVASWATTTLGTTPVLWLLGGLVLEAGSMAAFAQLQRRVLADAGVRLAPRTALAIAYAGNAVSVTIPLAGSTAGAAFTYRQYVHRGASGPMAAWAIGVAGVFSTITFGVLVGAGAIANGNALAAAAGVLGIMAATIPMIAILVAMHRPAARLRLERIAACILSGIQHLVRRPRRAPAEVAASVFDQLSAYRMQWRHGMAAGTYAALNWLLDALCLWTVLQAFGVSMPFRDLPLLYAAVIAAASLGFTPAGIGTVEAAIALALVNLGGAGAPSLLAAVAYRAISTWLVLLIGWAVIARMRRVPAADGDRPGRDRVASAAAVPSARGELRQLSCVADRVGAVVVVEVRQGAVTAVAPLVDARGPPAPSVVAVGAGGEVCGVGSGGARSRHRVTVVTKGRRSCLAQSDDDAQRTPTETGNGSRLCTTTRSRSYESTWCKLPTATQRISSTSSFGRNVPALVSIDQ
ncbi:MAG: rane protein [Ilumatobacteraceae bacterium]|nr:rane protein [Ilumatobacteraceae bacterium]